MSPQVPKSATSIDGAVLDDKREQVSTTVRPQSSPGNGDEGYSGIAVPSKAPPTMRDIDSRRREGSRTSVSIAPAIVNHLIREARNEDYQGNPIQMSLVSSDSEHASIDRGDGAVRSRQARHGVDPDFSIPQRAPTVTTELHSVDRGESGDRVLQRGEASFIPASNQIFPTPGVGVHFESAHFTGGGHTFGNNSVVNNTFMSGDGQFTKIERNLVCCTYTSRPKHNVDL
ncbi:hypothetical protein JOM56_000895 [Amanita muscaria]